MAPECVEVELPREFEFIETSPGFVQFLGENWILDHKKKSIIMNKFKKNCQITGV